MTVPDGNLTSSQFEILQVLWARGAGMTVSEIWEEISRNRSVVRTTVLNLVDRLEKRGWLVREKVDGLLRYQPTMDRAATECLLASGFVEEFFAGSASHFLLSLLGASRPTKAELRRLRELVDSPLPRPSKNKE